MSELLLGCGHSRKKRFRVPGTSEDWEDLVTLDINPDCKPDLVCNLETFCVHDATDKGLNFITSGRDNRGHFVIKSDQFAEVHAYEVLEHLGRQGDITSFFNTFNHIYRILIPGGYLFATCPSIRSVWAWGDPGHTRAIQEESLIFLDQGQYTDQIGKTSMSDYRYIWKGDFKILSSTDDGTFHRFVLQAIKPARSS